MSTSPSSQCPRDGLVFHPTDLDLVSHYLRRKINGERCGDIIQDMDVYSREPWLLPHKTHPLFAEGEWYYYVELVKLARKSDGTRPKRTIREGDNGGHWKATGGSKIVSATRQVVGLKKTLTFDTNKKMKDACRRAKASTSGWVMIEYRLNSKKFQDQVICWIRDLNKRYRPREASSSPKKDQTVPIDGLEIRSLEPCPARNTVAASPMAIPSVPPPEAPQAALIEVPNWLEDNLEVQTEDVLDPVAPQAAFDSLIEEPNTSLIEDQSLESNAPEIAKAAQNMPLIEDQSLGVSDVCHHAETIPPVTSQSSLATALDAAESEQKDKNTGDTVVSENENWLRELLAELRAEMSSNPTVLENEESPLIDAPKCPGIEDKGPVVLASDNGDQVPTCSGIEGQSQTQTVRAPDNGDEGPRVAAAAGRNNRDEDMDHLKWFI